MKIAGTNAHLTYCLNVHPVANFADVEQNVFKKAAAVFKHVCRATSLKGPYGLGLWIPAASLGDIAPPGAAEAFKKRLDGADFYVFTMNGFPFGKFHGTQVKESVYRPDWSKPERLEYTRTLAEVLARLLPEGIEGTISTVPVTFGAWANNDVVEASVTQLMELVISLEDLSHEKGKDVAVALEPEPFCMLETAGDVIRFFNETLLPGGTDFLAGRGYSRDTAERAIRRRIGVCYDTIHAAVMFEDSSDAIARLSHQGIRILKLHIGSAVEANVGTDGPGEDLKRFSENIYLHQVTVVKKDGETVRFLDMPDALGDAPEGKWRVHFHVPHGALAGGASSTSDLVSERVIRSALEAGVKHFEVETYTLNVLPGFTGSVEEGMAEEVAWAYSLFSGAVK